MVCWVILVKPCSLLMCCSLIPLANERTDSFKCLSDTAEACGTKKQIPHLSHSAKMQCFVEMSIGDGPGLGSLCR